MTPTKPKPWNWLTFLKSAVKKEPGEKEWRRAIRLAGNWPTCACGQLCKALPREHGGYPVNYGLYQLGIDFSFKIDKRQWPSALSIFLKIEARTAKLLKAGKKKGNHEPN